MRRAFVAIVGITLAVWHPSPRADGFEEKAAGFSVIYKNEASPYRDAAMFVMPREAITIAVDGPSGDYALATANGDVTVLAPRKWTWRAPATAGLYDVEISGPAKTHPITLHAFVKVPASAVEGGYLNGYRIGEYPARPLNGNPLYLPPEGFVEVTKANEDTHLSPHFKLKQFICKQDSPKEFPKYLVLHERLPLKLEAVLQLVNTLGFRVDTLHVMSGYRTPYYNHAIGDVLYSMHQWGSAADVFVDRNDKGRMEDLNHDHHVDIGDAKFLYDQVERMLTERPYQRLQGGMGFYAATVAHPPFVHLDVRGTNARWKG